MGTADMKKAVRDAAVLRNLIETVLRAAADPMGPREIFEWPSIRQYVGASLNAHSRVNTQLYRMVKEKRVLRQGGGNLVTYSWNRDDPERSEATVRRDVEGNARANGKDVPEVRLRINRAQHSVNFLFEGLSITIEIVG